ncbi:MAG: type I-D CRISPR-associated protein Cas7/Csc2 [Methanomicrobiales archaeon]|nr:type I-D CRISPR-associated protein Cas7/Csc2 [Methanomicrobiales archaeon]MDI6876078.1 type I-D CRISPR-associated protein Cas7/Csc2 [Methanomicrobiales archaeon]
MSEMPELPKLDYIFLDEIPLYRRSNTLQLLLLRQTHDYTIFRTEETRELNIVTLPRHREDPVSIQRVAMFASKQKAAESRHFAALLRSLADEKTLDDEQKTCELKDALCQKCPRCVLFGSVSTESTREGRFNIKHRASYSTAYSIEPYEEIAETLTFNAVNTATQSTGQALGSTENVVPLANFPSVVTLNSVTKPESILFLKALLTCRAYGAETRTKGTMNNILAGIVAGYEEVITSLDYTLAASVNPKAFVQDPIRSTYEILCTVAEDAHFRDHLVILSPEEVEEFRKVIAAYEPDDVFMRNLYGDAKAFFDKIGKYEKASKKASKEEK